MDTLDRRQFIQAVGAIGAGLFVANTARSQSDSDVIQVGVIGAGAQGQVLMDAILKLGKESNVRIIAVCDIWKEFNLVRASRRLDAYKALGHKGTAYVDYREMLDKESDLDAVIIATPDFWHAEQTCAALEKGLHVYCEKEMSNTIEGARRMVQTARKTGKLLQIGHQRRSNPRYRYCYEKYIKEAKLLGRITTINGQWNRSRASCEDITAPAGREIDPAILKQYGYEDMHQFLNWRWFKGLGGGPIVDLGSHQIDIYGWFLDAKPSAVVASGSTDYWTGRQWYDNVMAIYEYQTAAGRVRAFYQTTTTTSANGYFESFMGDHGTLVISESANRGSIYRESWVAEDAWQKWVDKGYLVKVEGKPAAPKPDGEAVLDVREGTYAPAEYKIPVKMEVPYHQPHLVNFFNAIRGKEPLNCPPEVGFETAVTVLKVNDAIEKGCKLDFSEQDFTI